MYAEIQAAVASGKALIGLASAAKSVIDQVALSSAVADEAIQADPARGELRVMRKGMKRIAVLLGPDGAPRPAALNPAMDPRCASDLRSSPQRGEKNMQLIACMAILVALAGCASPTPQTPGAADKDTSFTVDERPDGFVVTVQYARYQFIPESASVQASCRQALTATAFDVADKRGRKIDPINEQRIRTSMGRNGVSGITSCEASVPVFWAK